MSELGSHTSVSPSRLTWAARPARHAGSCIIPASVARDGESVAGPIPNTCPGAVGPWGARRLPLHQRASSSPARPRVEEGALKVSQNAADGNPHPGPPGTGTPASPDEGDPESVMAPPSDGVP